MPDTCVDANDRLPVFSLLMLIALIVICTVHVALGAVLGLMLVAMIMVLHLVEIVLLGLWLGISLQIGPSLVSID